MRESEFDRARRQQYERLDADHALTPEEFDAEVEMGDDRNWQVRAEADPRPPSPRVGDPWLRHTDREDADR
jgi:hypothetical protein